MNFKNALSHAQIQFLQNFFNISSVNDFIEQGDLLDPNNIAFFTSMYERYLENSQYANDKILKSFISELKASEIHYSKKGTKIKNKQEKKSLFSSHSETNCKNKTINEWRRKVGVLTPNNKKQAENSQNIPLTYNQNIKKLTLEKDNRK